MNLDAKKIYGWALSQCLLVSNCEWVQDLEHPESEVYNHPKDGDNGYIFEVDLEYPKDLHTAHNSYPLAPDSIVVQKEWMSEYQ